MFKISKLSARECFFRLILAFMFLPLALAQAAEMPGAGVTVQSVEGSNLTEKFQHQIIYRALERLGYSVAEPMEVTYQAIHVALGRSVWPDIEQIFCDRSKPQHVECGGFKTDALMLAQIFI